MTTLLYDHREHFDGMTAYGRSKLAQVMFTFYLNDRLKSIDSNVEVVAAHPGIVDTDIFNATLLKRLFPFLPRLFFKVSLQTIEYWLIVSLHKGKNKFIKYKK